MDVLLKETLLLDLTMLMLLSKIVLSFSLFRMKLSVVSRHVTKIMQLPNFVSKEMLLIAAAPQTFYFFTDPGMEVK